MNSRPNLALARPVAFPYLVHVVNLNDLETVGAPEPGWIRFRFLRRARRPDAACKSPACVTCILPANPAFPHTAEVVLDVECEALMSAAAELLQRRVFSPPQFTDQPEDLPVGLEPIANILDLVARRASSRMEGYRVDALLFFQSVTRLIFLYWPNSETAELELGSAGRPPQALRQALAYIACKRGVVESAESVANHSGTGLRTLEKQFSHWFGIGLGRYAKIMRLKFLSEQQALTHADLASLAEVYRFSNVSRLRQEVSELDWATVAGLLPQNFYRTLLIGKTSQEPVGRARPRSAHIKGNANV
jgi:AraC-like DNA-binding protein